MQDIRTISVLLSTPIIAMDHPRGDELGPLTIGREAVDAVEQALAAKFPEASLDVDWTREALFCHRIEVNGGMVHLGDLEYMSVRDAVLGGLCGYLQQA